MSIFLDSNTMKSSKDTKKKSKGGGGNSFQELFVWHGEKVVVGIIVVVALWVALQGLGYQTLSWQPSALEEASSAAERNIRENTRAAEDEGVVVFDYAEFAEQIKEPIPADPYRNTSPWYPALSGAASPAGTP